MHVDRRLLTWGVFLVLAGGVPLAAQAGLVPRGVAWWELWPLALIGAGLGILLVRTRFEVIGGLIVAATFGVIAGGLLAGGSLNIGCGDRTAQAFPASRGTFDAATAQVSLQVNCGDLVVTTATGSGWSVEGTGERGRPPEITSSADRLEVRSPSGFAFFGVDARQAWAVTLPTNPSLRVSTTVNGGTARLGFDGAHLDGLSATVNAGELRFDLSRATVGDLSTTVNAGSAKISLPSTSMGGSITVNAGSLGLCVPSGVGIRIRTGGGVASSNNFEERGLVHSGNTWQSEAYGLSSASIDLSATANAGTIDLNPDEGCV